MRKQVQIHIVQWEQVSVRDAQTRLKAAYDLLLSYPQDPELTETPAVASMPMAGLLNP